MWSHDTLEQVVQIDCSDVLDLIAWSFFENECMKKERKEDRGN